MHRVAMRARAGYFKTPGLSDYIPTRRSILPPGTRLDRARVATVSVLYRGKRGNRAAAELAPAARRNVSEDRIKAVIALCAGAVINSAAERRRPETVAKARPGCSMANPAPDIYGKTIARRDAQPSTMARRRIVHESAIRTALLDKEAVRGTDHVKISMARSAC